MSSHATNTWADPQLSRASGVFAGLPRERLVMAAAVTCISATLAAFILLSNGSLMAGGAFLAVLIFLAASIYRIEFGFYLLFLSCLLFGQFEVPGFSTATYRVSYFKNVKEIHYLPYFSRGDLNLFELQFLFLVALWIIVLIMNRDVRIRSVPLWFAWLLWYVWFVVAFINGMQHGGEFMPALWEMRSIAYFGVVYLFVPQVIRTRAHVAALFWVMILGLSVKAFEGISRWWENGRTTIGTEAMMAHEDPMFIAGVLLFGLCLVILKAGKAQRVAIGLLSLPLAMGFYVGQRRAAYAAAIISFVALLLIVPYSRLFRAMKLVLPMLLVVSVYTVVFWESTSSIASPIQKIKSGIAGDEDDANVVKDRNYYSNLYRKIEDYDLAITIQSNPAIGIGFGMKYQQPLQLARLDFALRDYMAHNNILWLFAKVGAIGFFLFWFFLNGIAFRGAAVLGRLKDPYLQAVAMVIVFSVINTMSLAFFDLHIVRYRTMIVLAVMLGLLGVLESIEAAQSLPAAFRARKPGGAPGGRAGGPAATAKAPG